MGQATYGLCPKLTFSILWDRLLGVCHALTTASYHFLCDVEDPAGALRRGSMGDVYLQKPRDQCISDSIITTGPTLVLTARPQQRYSSQHNRAELSTPVDSPPAPPSKTTTT